MTSEEWSAIEDDIYASGRIYKLIADLAACEKDREDNYQQSVANMDRALKAEAENAALLRSIASWKREELEWDAMRESIARHFHEKHLTGDGPEIDRLRAKLEKCRGMLREALPNRSMITSGMAQSWYEERDAALAETKEEVEK
jgi:hypothetical protein